MEPTKIRNAIMAVLFAAEEPVTPRKLASILDDVSIDEVHQAVDTLVADLQNTAPSILLEKVAGGLQLSTNPEFAEYVARMYSGRRKQRLSRAAMETLAIIAYKQPITRADCEVIRGVGCGGVITTLMERSLIKITGKAKVLGAPFLYGTTTEFLEYLGLNSLKDLPSMEELEALLVREEADAQAEEQRLREDDADDALDEGVGVDGDGAGEVEASDGEAADPAAGARVEGDADDKLLGGGSDRGGETATNEPDEEAVMGGGAPEAAEGIDEEGDATRRAQPDDQN